jgi:hypothetical protein
MLTEELRNKLIELMKTDPQAAIEELKKDPKLLEILLSADQELKKTQEQLYTEKIKYVNMTTATQNDLQKKAQELKTTQGLLIGAGIVLILALLSKKR